MRLPPPIGYGDARAAAELIDVLFETRPGCEIYWFHWPRNGIIQLADYEPILYVSDPTGHLCIVGVRRHWIWHIRGADEVVQPVQIVFRGSSHAPDVKTIERASEFDREVTELTRLQGPLRRAQAGEIPEWNLQGLNPVSVYDVCQRLRKRCETGCSA